MRGEDLGGLMTGLLQTGANDVYVISEGADDVLLPPSGTVAKTGGYRRWWCDAGSPAMDQGLKTARRREAAIFTF